jgi:cyclophilin family peptidyl-prolyl cis-trans isomerase
MPRLRLRLSAAAFVLSCSLALAACGGSDSGDSASATPEPATSGTTTETGCEKVTKPQPKPAAKLPKPTKALEAGKTYAATVSTSCGDFTITLDAERAPKTGGSFMSLAEQGFYDDTTFHRIVPGFVIQGGDPEGKGTGGPGYQVVEAPPAQLRYMRGVVAMAKTQLEDPGTSGSQFFVVTAEDAQLPPDYALLGKITGGQDVVDKIASAQTDQATEQPLDPIVIQTVEVAVK